VAELHFDSSFCALAANSVRAAVRSTRYTPSAAFPQPRGGSFDRYASGSESTCRAAGQGAIICPRVSNNGAVIHIVSPANGAICPAGMDIQVCVMTDSLVEVLHGLKPGGHKIEVFLADGEHRDLEQGDAIRVVVR
jgi:hypothetical protein